MTNRGRYVLIAVVALPAVAASRIRTDVVRALTTSVEPEIFGLVHAVPGKQSRRRSRVITPLGSPNLGPLLAPISELPFRRATNCGWPA